MAIKRQSCITILSLVSACIAQFLSAQELYFNNFEDKDDISFWGCGYPAIFGTSEKAEKQGLMSIGHKGLFSTFEGGKANSGARAFKLDITLPLLYSS